MKISAKKRRTPKYTPTPFPFQHLSNAILPFLSFAFLKQLFLVVTAYIPVTFFKQPLITVALSSQTILTVPNSRDADVLWKNGCFGRRKMQKEGVVMLLTRDEALYLTLIHAITVKDHHVHLQIHTLILKTRPVPISMLWSLVDPIAFIGYWFYRSRGYSPKSGILYGCDYMLYRIGADFYHADFGVNVIKEGARESVDEHADDWIDMQATVRSLAKVLVECHVCAGKTVPGDECSEADILAYLASATVNDYSVERHAPSRERH